MFWLFFSFPSATNTFYLSHISSFRHIFSFTSNPAAHAHIILARCLQQRIFSSSHDTIASSVLFCLSISVLSSRCVFTNYEHKKSERERGGIFVDWHPNSNSKRERKRLFTMGLPPSLLHFPLTVFCVWCDELQDVYLSSSYYKLYSSRGINLLCRCCCSLRGTNLHGQKLLCRDM